MPATWPPLPGLIPAEPLELPSLLDKDEFSQGTGNKISADDPRLPRLLNGAQAAVRNYCEWHIAPVVEETMIVDADGGLQLSLPTLHVDQVLGVLDIDHGHLIEGVDFEWSVKGELRRLRGRWPNRYRSVQVQVRHGFASAPDVVQVIQQACALAVASPLGATHESAAALAVQWGTTAPGVAGGLALLDRDLDILNHYRIVSA